MTAFLDQINALAEQTVQLCYHCHKCTAGCPAVSAMTYGPDRALRMIQLGQVERLLTSRDIWLCLGCEACAEHCPNDIDAGQVFIALRREAGRRGYRQGDCQELRAMLADYLAKRPGAAIDDRLCQGLGRLNQLGETITDSRNISGDDNRERLIWSQNLERVPEGLEGKKGAETVYFVGCVGSFFPRSYRVPQAMASILEAAGVDFTTLGGQEWCCGFPLLSMGRMEEAEELMHHNIAQVKELGATRLVTTCPSCYHIWRFDYPEVTGEDIGIEVLHASELLEELIDGQAIQLGEIDKRVTFHDPCDLGRKSGVLEPPRRVLKSIPGLSFVEMGGYGLESDCCGGGGNLESFDPDVVSEVSSRRIDQACEVEADIIASACQQCERTLTNAARRHQEARRLRMRSVDVVELVWQAMSEAA
jgi:heterodisulfide reductase subunit D